MQRRRTTRSNGPSEGRSRRGISRRNLLRGAGGIAVALPFLESMNRAQAGGTPLVRYLQFMHVEGTLVDEWAPSGPPNQMVLSPILSPLESRKGDIVVVSGLENAAAGQFGENGHISNGHTIFTSARNTGNNAMPDGPSIDQVIAERMAAPTPHRSLQFAIGGGNLGEYQALYAGAADPVPSDTVPTQIFAALFSDLEVDPDLPATTIQRLHARRQSVLDTVLGSLEGLAPKVSAADRITLENHADKIRELELQLANEGEAGAGCTTPVLDLPADYDTSEYGSAWDANRDDVSSRVLIDLMVMALACDLTRVGTLQYTNYDGPTFPWLGLGIPGAYTGWHAMVHDIPNMGDVSVPRAVYTWYMGELAYLIDQLAAMPDQDGTLLDNMLLYSTGEMGDPAAHGGWSLPIVLAGRAGGALETGRHSPQDGRTTGDLYATFLSMLGLGDTTFGAGEFTSGPLTL
jgi:hypothetical protein